MTDTYRVERHGGMSCGAGSKWRVVAEGDLLMCTEVYENIHNGLRQGAVKLYLGQKVLRSCSAPRLRTRW